MTFIEPAGPQAITAYRAPLRAPEPWLALAGDIDPQVAQCFLVSARCGCFMQAARSLNVKATWLRKQLMQLEARLQRSLFNFQGSALTLSREGRQLQSRLKALADESSPPLLDQPLVRLAVAESILHDILGRDLIALLRRNASARLQIITLDSELALQAVSADLVLWLSDPLGSVPGPSFPTLPPEHLARLDYLPHIAKRYSRPATRPGCLGDLNDYMLVQWQADRQPDSFAPWNTLLEQRRAGVVQVQSYELMLEMIRCSACIGLLPQYMSHFDRGLVALPGLFDVPMQRHLWMAVGTQARQTPEVRMLVEMIQHALYERRDWFQA
ncbi:DNA-binding transcriptional regulator, LysR family [Pseudomonas sp. NFACC09-4]|uniref:LysR family transcriptional regulator n=1 Tax=Pseudomonas TaxID=286 RepID=UPI000908C114|nr:MULTISPECIES: LysR family transcriptional regulator [Pseudomonas]MDT8905795.1 LysR family transcriptional regulator [Pseudomonas prosekii]NHN68007.1 LysR family transcriptional regulator [Pseudomonas fluorescens]SFW87567.1 DNA-binding transcriptional regulator, LysR family [Pseudomonas sp. NFACC09-4]SFY24266.1 DNA-binding transcriptional regulator, LysR family [Pseudomonas sp. NFACC49-2]SFY27392.1 DNA-binding transcriptional regulator, LysR family [Pseudomonas sp. NFACC36]